jgi:hypothetical protein
MADALFLSIGALPAHRKQPATDDPVYRRPAVNHGGDELNKRHRPRHPEGRCRAEQRVLLPQQRKVTDDLGTRHQAIQHSYEMLPETPVAS